MLYFLKNLGQVSSIEYAFQSGCAHREAFSGPDGGRGFLCCCNSLNTGNYLKYAKHEQDWVQTENGIQIGKWRDRVLEEKQLRRADMLDGHWVKLADDQKYLVPVARRFDNGGFVPALPSRIAFSENGWSISGVSEKYDALWRDSIDVYDALVTGETEMDLDRVMEIFTHCLATNYRVGAYEISLLGLADTDNRIAVLQALIDLPTVVEQFKKKQEVAT